MEQWINHGNHSQKEQSAPQPCCFLAMCFWENHSTLPQRVTCFLVDVLEIMGAVRGCPNDWGGGFLLAFPE